MNLYIGTKLINARPMTRSAYNTLRGWPLPADENGEDDGYLVEYIDGGKANHPEFSGYISWSPADVFNRAYRLAHGMPFSTALNALKRGCRVARSGWNGKGMWVALHTPTPDDDMTQGYLYIEYPEGHAAYPNGSRIPWLASQSDLLAEDWVVVPEGQHEL